MPDYGISKDQFVVISGSGYLFPSGTLQSHNSSISSSVPQILAITCSNNINNKLTRATTLNAYAKINLHNAASNLQSSLILRYISSSYSPSYLNPNSTLYATSSGNSIFVNIPLQNNDDAFAVAYKTVNALINANGYQSIFSASLVDDGSGLLHTSSSLGENMNIGTEFKIRSSSISGTTVGNFLIYSLKSGSTALPDFSGTEARVGGMEIGDSFKIGAGSGSQLFSYNIIQSGSGGFNQIFSPGNYIVPSASLGMTLDPADKTSGIITGSGAAKLYLSSSGKVGIGTTNPVSDVDIVADEIKLRTAEETGVRINNEGNFESFLSKTAGASTGSELILKASRDSDGRLNPGDVLGSLKWVSTADTDDERKGGEAASIRGVVKTSDGSGVTANISFLTSQNTDEPATEKVKIGADGTVHITGSVVVSGDVDYVNTQVTHITASGDISASGDIIGTINGGEF